MSRPKMHFIPEYLLNPSHPVTVCLIGCGGTGSHVLACLGRISYSLQALGHPGLYVPDTVSQSNVGRQSFGPSDTGQNKAVLLATRVNAFYGTGWRAVPSCFNKDTGIRCNLTLTCTDTAVSRLEVGRLLEQYTESRMYAEPYMKPYYWLDIGNARDTGQVVLGSLGEISQPGSALFETTGKLPLLTERFDLTKAGDKDPGPSCSHADALRQQNLFINPSLAQLGCDILWEMLTEGMIPYAGFYLNLKTKCANPMPLEQPQEKEKKKKAVRRKTVQV